MKTINSTVGGNTTNGTMEDEVVDASPSSKAWCRFNGDEYSERGFHIAFFVSSFAIPLILIVLLYIGMLRRLWHPANIGNKISKESLRNKRRVTRYSDVLKLEIQAIRAYNQAFSGSKAKFGAPQKLGFEP